MKSYTEKEMNNALDELHRRTAGLEGHELRSALTQFMVWCLESSRIYSWTFK